MPTAHRSVVGKNETARRQRPNRSPLTKQSPDPRSWQATADRVEAMVAQRAEIVIVARLSILRPRVRLQSVRLAL